MWKIDAYHDLGINWGVQLYASVSQTLRSFDKMPECRM